MKKKHKIWAGIGLAGLTGYTIYNIWNGRDIGSQAPRVDPVADFYESHQEECIKINFISDKSGLNDTQAALFDSYRIAKSQSNLTSQSLYSLSRNNVQICDIDAIATKDEYGGKSVPPYATIPNHKAILIHTDNDNPFVGAINIAGASPILASQLRNAEETDIYGKTVTLIGGYASGKALQSVATYQFRQVNQDDQDRLDQINAATTQIAPYVRVVNQTMKSSTDQNEGFGTALNAVEKDMTKGKNFGQLNQLVENLLQGDDTGKEITRTANVCNRTNNAHFKIRKTYIDEGRRPASFGDDIHNQACRKLQAYRDKQNQKKPAPKP